MFVPTDPILGLMIAAVLWGLWAACKVYDSRSERGWPSPVAFGPHCGLCGGPHDYDDCPLEDDAA